MKKSKVNGLKKLEFTKNIIANLTNHQSEKIMGGETDKITCGKYSLDGACDSLKTYTKSESCKVVC